MATQGLFTKGPTVEDLLEKRNKRATDLQQTLMANAGKRARDPAKAQAISFLGSTLGRALGNASGGEDEQMQKRKNQIASQEAMQQDFATSSQGTGVQQKALAERLMKGGFYQEAAIVSASAKTTLAEEAAALQLEQDKIAADAKLKVQNQNNARLADRVKGDMPLISESVRSGDPDAIEAAYAFIKEQRTKNGGVDSTAADKNWQSLSGIKKSIKRRSELEPSDPAYLSPSVAAEELRQAKVTFGAGENSYQSQMGKEEAKMMGSLLVTAGEKLENSEPTKRLIESSLKLLDSGELYTGAGGAAYLGLQKVLIALGAPVNTHSAAAGENFRSNAMSFVLKYISQTKGAISNAEMQKFEAAAMGLGNTELGNRLILDLAKQAVEFEQGESIHMLQWKSAQDTYPTPEAYKLERQNWRDDNRFTPKTVAEIDALAKGLLVLDDTGKPQAADEDDIAALEALISR